MSRRRKPNSSLLRNRKEDQLRRAYDLMMRHFGHQGWWPGETPFEVCVGAILTQNTSWSNVERAIANLKRAGVMDPRRMLALSPSRLARLLKPSGYFNVKAARLRSFLCALVHDHDASLENLFAGSTSVARERLLAINGIGPETADSMLLYAGGHHSFVIDAYTKRIFLRHGWAGWKVQRPTSKVQRSKSKSGRFTARRVETGSDYHELKALCEVSLNHKPNGERLDYWQDYHAQLVMVGKHFCRTINPLCEACPLKPLLPGPENGLVAGPLPAFP